MKVTVGQVYAASSVINAILAVRRDKNIKPRLTYTLLAAQNILAPYAEAFEIARHPLVLECFDVSRQVQQENGQTVVPPKTRVVDGVEVVDLELQLKFKTEIEELAGAEIELDIGQISIDQLDSLDPAPMPHEIAGLLWLLKE